MSCEGASLVKINRFPSPHLLKMRPISAKERYDDVVTMAFATARRTRSFAFANAILRDPTVQKVKKKEGGHTSHEYASQTATRRCTVW